MNAAIRTLAATLALTAMLLRGLLPAGWMPEAQAAGPALTICSFDGLHHVPTRDPAHGQGEEHGFACPFAAAAHLAPPHWSAPLPQPVSVAAAEAVFDDASAFHGEPYSRPATRAPPLSI